ncbi:MAG TPA: hypothetical protein VMA73_22710 [Streptosporangiaceae bacterium]|nr:hypothetical protein [Streptosporangiaceae bacterium]
MTAFHGIDPAAGSRVAAADYGGAAGSTVARPGLRCRGRVYGGAAGFTVPLPSHSELRRLIVA